MSRKRARFQLLVQSRWLAPTLILGLALVLRIWRLGDSNLWWDEGLAIWAVRKGFAGVTLWTAGDVHPPLYFWSLWAWVSALGESEFAMRLLSVSFGVLTVAAVYALAHRIAGRRAAIWASLLTAVAPFHVWWSQEMRMYILAGLLGVISIYCLVRWLDDERDCQKRTRQFSPWLWAYVAATTGSLYTIFLMGIVVIAENIAVLVALLSPCYERKRLLWHWVLAQSLTGLLLAVWLVFSWDRMQTWSVSEPTTLRFVSELYATLLSSGVSVAIREVWWAWVPMVGVLASGCFLALTRPLRKTFRWSHVVVIVLSGLLPVVFVYLATLPRSLFYTPRVEARYLLPFAPMVWIMVGWSLELLAKRWWHIGLAAGIVIVGISTAFLPRYYDGRVLDDGLQSMVRSILSQAEQGDIVLLDSGTRYPVFLYYYERLDYEGERPSVYLVPPGDELISASSISEMMPGLVGDSGRVWLAEVETSLTDPDRLARAWLEERYHGVSSHAYGYNALTLFDAEQRLPRLDLDAYGPQHELNSVPFSGGALAGWEMPVEVFEPGSQVHVALLWEQEPVGPVSIEVISHSGELLAKQMQSPAFRQQFSWTVNTSWPQGSWKIQARSGDAILSLGTLDVLNSPEMPDALVALADSPCFADVTCLEGFALTDGSGRIPAFVSAGDEIVLDLTWLTREAGVEQEMVVFGHLLGDAYNPATSGPVWGQSDSIPSGGALSSLVWQPGDVVFDRHVIKIDDGAPSGVYHIEVGLYGTSDGARLELAGAEPIQDYFLLPVEIVLE